MKNLVGFQAHRAVSDLITYFAQNHDKSLVQVVGTRVLFAEVLVVVAANSERYYCSASVGQP